MTRKEMIEKINENASKYISFGTRIPVGKLNALQLKEKLLETEKLVNIKKQLDQSNRDEYNELAKEASKIWQHL